MIWVGGRNTDWEGNPSHGLIQWNESTIVADTSHPRDQVYMLAADGSDLAMGTFDNADGTPTPGETAIWDGTQWRDMGLPTGLGSEVTDLQPRQGKIAVDGNFDRVGNEAVYGALLWDGSTWQAMGPDGKGIVLSPCPITFDQTSSGPSSSPVSRAVDDVQESSRPPSRTDSLLSSSCSCGAIRTLLSWRGKIYAAGYFQHAGLSAQSIRQHRGLVRKLVVDSRQGFPRMDFKLLLRRRSFPLRACW